MKHTVKTQLFWEDTIHTLRDYLMNTPIPLIFEELLKDPDIFNNENWAQFMYPEATQSNPTPRKYKRESIHDFVWEYILKDTLLKVFRDRLLGSQTEPESYVRRSEDYTALFNDMLGGVNASNDLPDIIERFYGMMKDYLCRNLPGKVSDYTLLSTKEVLAACREAYHARRLRDDRAGDIVRSFYIDFENQTFSSALLTQFDEMSQETAKHPKSRHFIVLAELIQVMSIYIYMVEYIKYYPRCKGDAVRGLTYEEKTGRNLCLFTALATYDYKSLFFEERRRRDENKKFVG